MAENRELATTLDAILLRVIPHLIAQVPDAKIGNTYLSTIPNELFPNPAEFMFEISPSESWTFEQGHITGAGKDALHAVGNILVTIHSAVQLDQVGRDAEYLTNQARGILRLVTLVLDAMSNHDLLNADDEPMLSQPMRPVRLHIPAKDDRRKGFVTIEFEIEFDWDMTIETFS